MGQLIPHVPPSVLKNELKVLLPIGRPLIPSSPLRHRHRYQRRHRHRHTYALSSHGRCTKLSSPHLLPYPVYHFHPYHSLTSACAGEARLLADSCMSLPRSGGGHSADRGTAGGSLKPTHPDIIIAPAPPCGHGVYATAQISKGQVRILSKSKGHKHCRTPPVLLTLTHRLVRASSRKYKEG